LTKVVLLFGTSGLGHGVGSSSVRNRPPECFAL